MLRRVIISVGVASALLVIGAGSAAADPWGGVDCSQGWYTGCNLGAGQGGTPGPSQPGQPGQSNSGGQRGGGSNAGSPSPPGDLTGGGQSLANCSYVRTNYQPPSTGTTTVAYRQPGRLPGSVTVTLAAYRTSSRATGPWLTDTPPAGQAGAWYVYQCTGSGAVDGAYHLPIWIPDGQQPGAAPAPSPQQMAQAAYSQLRLPSPQIRANPAENQLVNLPTWMWVDPSTWGPRSATAAVPGVSVTATATPSWVTWQMGDGSTVTCLDAGTAFPAGDNPMAASPDCGHTYTMSSLGQPNNTFAVSATVHWSVTWAGAGQGGTFPDLTTTSDASFAVTESQALNRN